MSVYASIIFWKRLKNIELIFSLIEEGIITIENNNDNETVKIKSL